MAFYLNPRAASFPFHQRLPCRLVHRRDRGDALLGAGRQPGREGGSGGEQVTSSSSWRCRTSKRLIKMDTHAMEWVSMALHCLAVVVPPEDPPSHGWLWTIGLGSAAQASPLDPVAPGAQPAPTPGPRVCCGVAAPGSVGMCCCIRPRVRPPPCGTSCHGDIIALPAAGTQLLCPAYLPRAQRSHSLPQECHPPADPDSHPVPSGDSTNPKSNCPYICALSKPGHLVSILNGNNKPTPAEPGCPAHVLVDHEGLGTPCLGAAPVMGMLHPDPRVPTFPRLRCSPAALCPTRHCCLGEPLSLTEPAEKLPAEAMLAAPSESTAASSTPDH